jgi:molecular chaperone DnaK
MATIQLLCSEKFIKDNCDKVPADVKAEVEANLNPLKEAVKTQNLADIDKYTEALNKSFEKMYQASQAAGQQGPQADPQGPQGPQGVQQGPQGPGPDYGDNAPDEQ